MKENILFLLLIFITSVVKAQDIGIELGSNKIAINQAFFISISVKDGKISNHADFPELAGFRKLNISNSSYTNIINGKLSTEQKITQYYLPLKKGIIEVSSFSMLINDKKISANSLTVTVTDSVNQQKNPRNSLKNYFDSFLDNSFFDTPFRDDQTEKKEFINVDAEAFFSVTPSKREIYEGEGVNLDISLYICYSNQAKMEFYDLNNQLTDILEKIKPKNCWEENFNITTIRPEPVKIRNINYRKYKLFQASYFPINSEDIVLPKVGLEMIKYKVAKKRSFFSSNLKEDFITFYSKPIHIKVKQLPPHPLKNYVSVGKFQLKPDVIDREQKTGKTFLYRFVIEGVGNIAGIREPQLLDDGSFIFYPPNKRQRIEKTNQQVYGYKSFDYHIEPQIPATYTLSSIFEWIYFNTATQQYDTLTPNIPIHVAGLNLKNLEIYSQNTNDIESIMDISDNEIIHIKKTDHTLLNAFLIVFILIQISVGLVSLNIFKIREKISSLNKKNKKMTHWT